MENNHGEQAGHTAMKDGQPIDFTEWVWSERGENSFKYDTQGAMKSGLVIYVGPSGCDAWAEVGAAYASGVPILGLQAKGEQVGLMRRMVKHWCKDFEELLELVTVEAAKRI